MALPACCIEFCAFVDESITELVIPLMVSVIILADCAWAFIMVVAAETISS